MPWLSLVGTFAKWLFAWVPVGIAYFKGRSDAKHAGHDKLLAARERQLGASVNGPRSLRALIDRLRDRGGW
jgi:hypothetical protein